MARQAVLAVAVLGVLAALGAAASIDNEGNVIHIRAEDDDGDVVMHFGSDQLAITNLVSQLSVMQSTIEEQGNEISSLSRSLDLARADLADESSTARANEGALSTDYTGLLNQLNELSDDHSTLDGSHSNTFDLVQTLVTSLNSESSRAQLAEQQERNRALGAESVLAASATAGDNAVRGTITAEMSKLRADPPSLVPQGELIGELAIQSAGGCNGNFVRLWKNGELITWSQGRGLNCVHFKPDLTQIKTATYDTHGSAAATAQLAADIRDAETGTIIACGVIDEATSSLGQTFTNDGYSAMEQIGSHLIRKLQWRQSWAILGQKDAAGGFMPEDIGLAENTDPDARAPDGCNGYFSRPTKILRRQYYTGVRGALSLMSPDVEDHINELAVLEDVRHHGGDQVHVLQAQSKGACDGNQFLVWLDGQALTNVPRGRGINVMIFDPSDLSVVYRATYDTYASAAAANALAAQILSRPFGTIFVMGIIDEGVNSLPSNVEDIIMTQLGSHLIKEITYRESWVLIGRRGGDDAGLVVEDHGKAPSGPTSGCGGGGRPSAVVGISFVEHKY